MKGIMMIYFIVAFAVAAITFAVTYYTLDTKHQMEIRTLNATLLEIERIEVWREAFDAGWYSASCDAKTVLMNYEKMTKNLELVN